ncbi:ubiquitin carboxyl-terminal hydrolase 16-like [Ylistrum balloti]|uniref:ubiquitin carboxyl-terminal hydrolase 16-like n=1 Tax=Ylistrum balloti TaxID=509963 RepID=UPI0029058346|nr:ubiquitin carboxyl-terminal hydrolase 16-like [Ylistrum balloti]
MSDRFIPRLQFSVYGMRVVSFSLLKKVLCFLVNRRWTRVAVFFLYPFCAVYVFRTIRSRCLKAIPGQKSMEDKKKILGIPNVGNTCYMNAVLQVLCRTPNFREQLQTATQTRENGQKSKRGIITRLSAWSLGLLERITQQATFCQSPPQLDVSLLQLADAVLFGSDVPSKLPRAVLDAVRELDDQFKGNEQQDSYQLFNTVIGGLEDLCSVEARDRTNGSVSETEDLMNRSPVSLLFGGVFCTVYTYNTCNHAEPVFQRFTSIPIHIQQTSPNPFNGVEPTSQRQEETDCRANVSPQPDIALPPHPTEVYNKPTNLQHQGEVVTKIQAETDSHTTLQFLNEVDSTNNSPQHVESDRQTVSTSGDEVESQNVSAQKWGVDCQTRSSNSQITESRGPDGTGGRRTISPKEEEACRTNVLPHPKEVEDATNSHVQQEDSDDVSPYSCKAAAKTEVFKQTDESVIQDILSPQTDETDECENLNNVLKQEEGADIYTNDLTKAEHRESCYDMKRTDLNDVYVNLFDEHDQNIETRKMRNADENDMDASFAGVKEIAVTNIQGSDSKGRNRPDMEPDTIEQTLSALEHRERFYPDDKLSHLERGLRHFAEVNEIDGAMSCRTCEKTGKSVSEALATKTRSQNMLMAVPPVLVFQFNRFELNDGRLQKMDGKLTYPEYLDTTPFCFPGMAVLNNESNPDTEQKLYRLYGVVCHMGSIHGGHYTVHVRTTGHQEADIKRRFLSNTWRDPERSVESIIKYWEGRTQDSGMHVQQNTVPSGSYQSKQNNDTWYTISDKTVTECTEYSALSDPNAYLLMYERITPS